MTLAALTRIESLYAQAVDDIRAAIVMRAARGADPAELWERLRRLDRELAHASRDKLKASLEESIRIGGEA